MPHDESDFASPRHLSLSLRGSDTTWIQVLDEELVSILHAMPMGSWAVLCVE